MSAIDLEMIVADPKHQMRQHVPEAKVEEYAQLIREGVKFPAVEVVNVDGVLYLVDGFLRFAAHQIAGRQRINANVSVGSHADAIAKACGANATHGMPRTHVDKRNAVKAALGAFPELSARKIAQLCGVSHSMVNQFVAESVESKNKAEKPKEAKPAVSIEMPSVAKSEPKQDACDPKPIETIDGNPCGFCGSEKYVLTDAGNVCAVCSIEQGKIVDDDAEIVAEPKQCNWDHAAIKKAFGALVRLCAKEGVYDDLKESLTVFGEALETLRGKG